MPSSPGRRAVNAGLVLALAALAFASVQFIVTLRAHQQLRQDLAELDDIDYGMLDADAWVRQVSTIINKNISELRMTPERRKELEPLLEKALDTLLTQADAHLRQQARDGGFGARVKESVRERLIPLEDLKKGIPDYANAMLDQLDKPDTRKQLQHVVKGMLRDLSRGTRSRVDYARLDAIHARYDCQDHDGCGELLRSAIAANHDRGESWAIAVLALAAALMLGGFLAARRTDDRTPLAVLTLTCACLLACGVLTPMIDIEARISKLSFLLLGEQVEFHNQVLYFQSKSVLDVVRVLARTGKPEMIAVGILLVTFSVIFPLCKLAASFVYVYDVGGKRQNALVKFFALKSSKWSMADVFVVAMFMAYIGFNGVVNSELKAFADAARPEVHVMTLNGSGLQLGYFMFLAFCLAGLTTSQVFKMVVEDREAAPPAPRPRPPRPMAPVIPASRPADTLPSIH